MGSIDDQVKMTEYLRREGQRKMSTLPEWSKLTDEARARMVEAWVVREAARTRGKQ